ncbi:plexin-B-like [Glandiceps talaboti]
MKTENQLTCDTPPVNQRPAIPAKQDHVTVQLAIRSTETNINFVDTNFHFYKCSALKTCTYCVTSSWACDWCVYGNRCTHDSTTCSKDTTVSVVAGENNIFSSSNKKGQEFCPQLMEQDTDIFIPVGAPREFLLNANYSNLPKQSANYRCILNIEDGRQESPATVNDDNTITCAPRSYTYKTSKQELVVDVKVEWKAGIEIDDIHGNQVTLYNCSVDRSDCSECLSNITTKEVLNCGWCSKLDSCQIEELCTDGSWLPQDSDDAVCGAPIITKIWPLSGPIEGNTELVVNGSNLGKAVSAIKSVTVAGLPCEVIPSRYKVAKGLECTTPSCRDNSCGDKSGKVIVELSNGNGESEDDFYYRNPNVVDFNPKIGPEAGGTRLVITGEYMDAGRHITVDIDGSPCEVDRDEVNETFLICITSGHPIQSDLTLSVSFDGAVRLAPDDKLFEYTKNPNVTSVYPLESMKSGGRELNVTGEYFTSVKEPRMNFASYTQSDVFKSDPCVVLSAELMNCVTPNFTSPTSRRKRQTCIGDQCAYQIGFRMDGHEFILKYQFKVYEDPVYYQFEGAGRIKKYKGGQLIILGKDLNIANTKEEVTVNIGSELCNVTSLSPTQLDCEPPSSQPGGFDKDGNPTSKLPEVVVDVGNLNLFIGYLQYESEGIDVGLVGAILGAVFGIFVIAIIIIVVVFIVKTKHKAKDVEKLQQTMVEMELSVKNVACQRFAELQTEMSDLTSDLEGIGIPLLDFNDYAVNMLFVGQTDHPVFQKSTDALKPNTINGLRNFHALLKKKEFVLVLIHTLEEQKGVSPQDRVNIGSLLTVALQSEQKMGYLTDILKTLLTEAAQNAVEDGKEKGMLKSTVSIMEKLLTNWFVLTLYGFLKHSAGSSIFFLYKALKHQIEKGPVDSVTGFAKYSLTNDLLLKQVVEAVPLNINIVTEWDGDSDLEVKVLDIDTISQVKEKILDVMYKNTRYSRRPVVKDIDVEWRAGMEGQGHLTLQDQDQTSEVMDNWKRLNTLTHYGVYDEAFLALVYKLKDVNVQSNVRSPISVANQYDFLHFHDPDMAPDVISSNKSRTHILREEDEEEEEEEEEKDETMKVWHLMKSKHYYTQVFGNGTAGKSEKSSKSKSKGNKVISELFLTQMVSTKATVLQYVEDVFKTLLSVQRQQFPQFPKSVKYMFDFLDELAEKFDIEHSDDVTHIWKSNSLPLRIWANILKWPHFVFDINVNPTLTASLEIVAQAFVDSCSKTERKMGRETPANKLLFANEVRSTREKVDEYYKEIAKLPPIDERELGISLEEDFIELGGKFDKISALGELYRYATKYGGELLDALEDDETCKKQNLAFRLEQVAATMAENDYGEARASSSGTVARN